MAAGAVDVVSHPADADHVRSYQGTRLDLKLHLFTGLQAVAVSQCSRYGNQGICHSVLCLQSNVCIIRGICRHSALLGPSQYTLRSHVGAVAGSAWFTHFIHGTWFTLCLPL